MAVRGVGHPLIRNKDINGNVIDTINLPTPLKGGRKEEWENHTETFENINGEIITGVSRFRFKAEYEFSKVYGTTGAITTSGVPEVRDLTDVEGGLVDKLSMWYNESTMVNLVLHDDTPFINYDVIVEKIHVPQLDGNIYNDMLSVTFIGARYVRSIPTIDNMLGCIFYWRMFGLDDSNPS